MPRENITHRASRRGKFKGWKAYKDAREAAEAEAAAVAFVNEGAMAAPPLTEDDLADSRASAEWLRTHERKGLVEEGTLSHTGRPRFYSQNGFLEADEHGFQGDRFSVTVPVDAAAYRKDPEAYGKTGRWTVIPTLYPDADGVTRLHTGDAAEAAYRKSGGHFGIYEGLGNANLGAEWDHHKGNAEWAEGRKTRQDAKGGDTRSAGKSEKNTLLSETARAAWADLTRTRPRDRTAEDLTPKQKAALAKAWSVEGDGIYHYNAYDAPQSGPNSNALSPGYWFDKDPNHQVEKLFGRGTASWTSDGDLVFNDTYDLDFGGKNLPGIPTNADPDEVKIRSRISARALGLDPRKLWKTANARIQDRWTKLEPVMDRVYKDVQAGRYKGQVDSAIQEVQALQARYNRINSGPYKPETASTLAAWKHPEAQRLEEFGAHMDRMPAVRISTRQDAKGGDAGSETAVSETPASEAPQNPGGPRIVINPQVFDDKRDALCVAFNEAFRVVMELNGFEPASEPTEAQRKFFSDTAYADDELQLRRTILARIATLDTSVKDPTNEQLEETAEMLEMVMEAGAPQNEWEQSAVKRLHDVVARSLESTRANGTAKGTSQPPPDMV